MRFDPFRHHRRSIRLRGHDYAARATYFITICTIGHECLLGEVVDGQMRPNELGEIVRDEWERSSRIRQELVVDAYVVMPNHVHGLVHLAIPGEHVGARGARPDTHSLQLPGRSLGAFVAGFKSAATRRINALRQSEGTPVWQRNYYEHVVRDEAGLTRIRAYIQTNARRWKNDEYHPSRIARL